MKPSTRERIICSFLAAAFFIFPGADRTDAAGADPPSSRIPFPALWEQVQKYSSLEKASELDLKAALLEKEWSDRQGDPRVYLDARGYSSNDPALSFISLLDQRQIGSPDLAPDPLNHPGFQFYQKATLGIDFPLYEGGAIQAGIQKEEKRVRARELDRKSATLHQYTETAGLYGTLLVLENQRNRLQGLEGMVDNTLDRYRIGVKTNPLGYSGLLGLKSLRNKISGVLEENSSRAGSAKKALEERARDLPEAWDPDRDLLLPRFVHLYLAPLAVVPPAERASPRAQALMAEADASEKKIAGEKARQFPRVGIFSEGNLYGGNRDAASSYTLGIYLQWDLYSASRYGKAEQARLSYLAEQARAEEFRLQEKIDTLNAGRNIQSLEHRLSLLDTSAGLLDEQTQTSKKLFLNGAINALQLTDVFNHRLDVLIQLAESELEYLKFHITLMNGSDGEIPDLSAGGQHGP